MNIRKQIIELLEIQGNTKQYLLHEMYQCINKGELSNKEIDNFNEFFSGVIRSLYYKPSNKYLVIVGEQGVGKTEFLRRLIPLEMLATFYEGMPSLGHAVYSSLIVSVEDSISKMEMKSLKELVSSNKFVISNPYTEKPEAEKKLCSVVITTVTDYTDAIQQKMALIVHINSIDYKRYNSINKLELWREIFRIFKPR